MNDSTNRPMHPRTGPTFVNIGPGRCATSWLHEIFLAHPDVTMARVKETEFFNHNFEKGFDWYRDQFPDQQNSIVGEISNCYYTEPSLVERIMQYSPDMKIMINVRDPFRLMGSFHGFGIRRGINLPTLPNALDVPIGQLMGAGYKYRQQRNQLTDGDRVSLLESVLLSRHLKPVLATFPEENIYIFVFERLRHEKEKVIQEMYDFVGAQDTFVPPVSAEVVNASIAPKSKLIARMATHVSFLLRRWGAYRTLTSLHQSRWIKRVLYSDVTMADIPNVDPRDVLDESTKRLLDQEIADMIELYPPLRKWWGPLLPAEPITNAAR